MRLAGIEISDYGPIKSFQANLDSLEVIYGENEAGKTAFIDALTGALFAGRTVFPDQHRLSSGSNEVRGAGAHVTVRVSGQEYHFPGPIRFESIVGLPHYDLGHLFIVRAGELVFDVEDKKWQDSVKELLSGVPVNVERVSERIALEVGLTRKGEWSNRQPLRRKSFVLANTDLHERLSKAIDSVQYARKREKKLQEKEQELQGIRADIEDIENLRTRLRQEKVRQAHTNWRVARLNLGDYERYTDKDRTRWQQLLEKTRALEAEKEAQGELLTSLKDDLAESSELLQELEARERKLTRISHRQVQLNLDSELEKLLATKASQHKKSWWGQVSSLFSILALVGGAGALALAASGLTPAALSLLGVSLFVAGGYYLSQWIRHKSKQRCWHERALGFLSRARSIWPDAVELTDVANCSQRLQQELSEVQAALKRALALRQTLLEREEKKRTEVGARAAELERLYTMEEELRRRVGVPLLGDLDCKLKEKQDLCLELTHAHAQLSGLLGTEDPMMWEDEVGKTITSSRANESLLPEEENLRKRSVRLEQEIREMRAQVLQFTEGQLARLGIEQTTELWLQLDRVERELDECTLDKEAALLAWETLRRVNAELDESLRSVIVDPVAGVSLRFSQMTCERYRAIRWDNNSIVVQDAQGRILGIGELSTGTRAVSYTHLRAHET